MDAEHESGESIEVGLDSHEDQLTIVVGIGNNIIQSVIVVQSEFSKRKRNRRLLSSWFSNTVSARQSRSTDTDDIDIIKPASTTSLRSELLRPDSPISTRSSMFGGERRERDCSKSFRGRDSTRERDDRSMSHSRHGSSSMNHSRHGRQRPPVIETRQPTNATTRPAAINPIPRHPSSSSSIMSSIVPLKKTISRITSARKSRREEKKKKKPVIKLDTHGYSDIPPLQEKMVVPKEKEEKYLKNSKFRNPLYQPHRLVV